MAIELGFFEEESDLVSGKIAKSTSIGTGTGDL